MKNWQDFFTICWHPSPGSYIIHWKDSSRPVDMCGWLHKENAIGWIKAYGQALLDQKFEEEVLES